MSTATLKLPDDLKERIAAAAADAGKSPHACMVEAVAAQTALAERRSKESEKSGSGLALTHNRRAPNRPAADHSPRATVRPAMA